MNDNKSTVMNNAAVQQLRKVPGFDPMKLLRKTISVKTGHPVWKLDLRYKRLWFRLACPNGRMLLKPLRISDQLAIIEAQVYFSKDDPVPAASFTSEQRRENIPGGGISPCRAGGCAQHGAGKRRFRHPVLRREPRLRRRVVRFGSAGSNGSRRSSCRGNQSIHCGGNHRRNSADDGYGFRVR